MRCNLTTPYGALSPSARTQLGDEENTMSQCKAVWVMCCITCAFSRFGPFQMTDDEKVRYNPSVSVFS